MAYKATNGYDNKLKSDLSMGWVAGVAYAKPQLGILASLTYRSESDHKTSSYENLPIADQLDIIYEQENDVTLTLPESINLTAQTGLSPTSAVFTRIRYISWSDFENRPTVLNQTTKSLLGDGLPLVDFDDDQYSAELGFAKKLNAKLGGSISVLWDSGSLTYQKK